VKTVNILKSTAVALWVAWGVTVSSPAVDLPEAWMISKPLPPVVHIAKGLWWDFFGLNEAMAELGGAVVSSSYHVDGRAMRNFPTTWEQFASFNLMMLVNVNVPAIGSSGATLISEYVKNGGALFVFGGPFSLDSGGYSNATMAALLPCEMLGKGRVKADGGLVLKPADGAKGILPDDLSWPVEPRVFYYHEVQPKKEAKVLAMAGDKPILMVWQIGKGRVAVFAASAEGDPAPGQLAFWEWGDTPRLVASVSRWLMRGQGENLPTVKKSAETEKLLEELMGPTLGDDNEKREQLIRKLVSRCHDQAFAKEILLTVANYEGTPNRAFVMAVARAVQPFVDAGFEKEARELTDSGNVGKAALGLQILGACRSPGAQATIMKFLNSGAGALKTIGEKEEVKVDDLMAVTVGGEVGVDQRLKLAAVIALGDLDDPANIDVLKRETDKLGGKALGSAEAEEVADLNENILQQGLASRAKLGDGRAVGSFLDQILKNVMQMDEHYNFLDDMMSYLKDRTKERGRKMATRRLPALRQRQSLCLERLRQLPYSVYPDVARELKRMNDETMIPYAYAALAPKPDQKPPIEVARSLVPLLEDCTVPELRVLAVNLIAAAGDANAGKILSATLNRLVARDSATDVKFALRQLGRIPASDRTSIVKAALAHPDPKIRRLALASIKLVPEAERKALTPPNSAP
jgi:uncharacterized membrane protein